jgi:hypothetical protein
MKKIVILLFAAIAIIAACKKDITERNLQFAALNPAKTDSLAGTWKTLLLTAPDEFALAAPGATNVAPYTREINEIKSFQASLTDEQRSRIAYWSAGAVLRWNEIMRTLVARHNLAPYQNDNSTYPAPNAANPFAYPQFPFSNPPYAARAYAYVSAAQYDALVAAYHYKKLYNRPSPYTVDASIEVLVPKTTLAAYPSEDGVVEGVTVEMLKLLFPTEGAYIREMAEEEKLCRIMSGANVRSDIEAGEALGRLVASKFAARATADKAGAAIGTPTVWAQIESDCKARGETPWISLDMPKRPPMLPLFGNVKSFLIDSLTQVANRPVPPPLTASAQFASELAEVKKYADNPTRENLRIVHFWADGTGTYTPPGHWNAIAAEEFVQQNFSEVRWARNLALLNLSIMDAGIACWDAKYFYFNQRPSQADPSIKTLTGIPNFPAYVSGHSTFSAAAAAYLGHVIPARADAFNAMAKEASDSRLFGAIHYRSDCEKGLELGKKVAASAIGRARIDGAE